MAGKRVEVHVTLTNDQSRLLNAIKGIQLSGESDFITAMNIATLTLKHRQNKNQKQRIILFVGSPIRNSVEEFIQLGKKLKKYGIAVDIISFGNVDENKEHLKQFLDSVNNCNNSSILEVPVGFYLMDSLFTSPLMSDMPGFGDFPMENTNVVPNQTGSSNVNQQGGGGMTQFERDMNLAIQQSIEEERRLREAAENNKTPKPNNNDNIEMKPVEGFNEEDELERAKLLSMQEHEDVLKKQNEDEEKIKDELLENQDFIKDILQGINTTEIKDEEVQEVIKKIKDEKKKDDNEKDKEGENK
jgi:26S proteasome regulatory subunit N10